MKNIFLLFIITLTTFTGVAQKNILNPKFEVMLDTLLTHNVKEVLPKEVALEKDIIYLDSRAKNEFKVSHIENAKWVGFSSFNLKRIKDIPKDKKIVVYCTVGYRSEKIAEKLVEAGYTDVSNLYGGIFEWVHHNQPVVNDKGVTEGIHTYDKVWAQWLDKGIKTN